MSYKTPKEIVRAGVQTGSTKARLSWDKALVASFLAGAYIAIAGLLAIVISAGMPKAWGGLPTFITGAVFSLGLILVIIAGSELLTGNMGLVPLAARQGRASLSKLAENWAWMALAADDIAGKILAIFFPITAFVALGFDHVVANMFFLPVAIFADVPGIGWGDAVHNWFLGNLVGATIFVSAAYWFLYAREVHEEPGDTRSGAPEKTTTEGDGRTTAAAEVAR